MNAAQQSLYFRVWGECRTALKEHGRPHDDAARKALQAQALGGTVKSSKNLTNAELTKVLAKFRTWSEPGNFAAQMHAEEDPEQRRQALIKRAETLGGECGIRDGIDGLGSYFKKWLSGVPVVRLDADTLRKLVGILERRKAQLPATPKAQPKPAPVPVVAAVEADPDFDRENPFG